MGDGENPKHLTEKMLVKKIDFEKIATLWDRNYNDTARQLTNIYNLAAANNNTLMSKIDVLTAKIDLLTLECKK